jgi:uncharacterized RDD family membrane protein YckC
MTARDLEGQYAGFLTRAAGLFLDNLIIIALIMGTYLLTTILFRGFNVDLVACRADFSTFSLNALACEGGQLFLVLFTLLASPVYFVLFWSLVGQSIGQRVMGVRVVRVDGGRLGVGRSLVRWLGVQLCIVTLGIGFLWVLVDDRRMGWHDIIARTCVLYSWRAVQNDRFVDGINRRLRRKKGSAAPEQLPQ